MSEPIPILTYADAECLGEALHDHMVRMTGTCPFKPGDLGLADTVQFLAFKARERVAERERI